MELQITSIFAIIAISAIIALASNVMTEKSAPKPPPISEFKSFSSKIKTSSKPEIINLLVIDEVSTNNWYKLFQKQKLSDGTPIRVEQCGWQDIDIYVEDISSGKGRAICNLSATSSPIFGTPQNTNRTISPDFVLVRNTPRRGRQDFRNILYGLYFANIPSVNSLSSIIMCQERPVMMAELNRLRKLHGDKFPTIDQMFFANNEVLWKKPIYDKYVLKVGFSHAGNGKVKIDNVKQHDDVISIVQMYPGKHLGKLLTTKDYYTAEPFIPYEADVRIQKIGDHYRAFKRTSVSGNWKVNVGGAEVQDVPITDKFKFYITEASKLFGGLDLCALDILQYKGRDYILELNDSAIGLNPNYEQEDTERIRDYTLKKMNQEFCK